MRIALGAVCVFTVCAVTFLSLSLLVLQPPRANVQVWFPAAALFAAQGVLTLVAMSPGGGALRRVVMAGGCAVALIGGSWAATTLYGPHFEGYALLLGSALVLQGALTILVFAGPRAPRVAA